MKLRKAMRGLQNALLKKGKKILINQHQIYFEDSGKMCTKYEIKEMTKINGKKKNITLLETFSIVDVVMKLAEINGGG